MNEKNEFRADLFPSGACVTPDALEVPGDETVTTTEQLFNEIDHGHADERMLVLAKRACETCIQFTGGHCAPQAEALATELWQRGVGLQFIGGKAISLENAERPLSDEQPAFTWDLSVIPKEPEAALGILRQGLRAGQFSVRGAFGSAFSDIMQSGEKYLEHLEGVDAELHEQILQLSPESREQAFKYILAPLFQQKDYTNFIRGKNAPKPEGGRYHPQYFNPETDGSIVSLYFNEVLRINELGLSKPAQKAAYFTSSFYTRLIDSKPAGLAFKAFDKIITDAPLMPLTAIEKYEQSHSKAVRQDAPSTYVKSAALSGRHGNYKEKVVALCQEYPNMPQQIVRQVCAKHPGNPSDVLAGVAQRLTAEIEEYGEDGAPVKEAERALLVMRYAKAEDYLAALKKFSENVAELTDRFGKGTELTPHEIRNFSLINLNDAVGAALAFRQRLERLRSESDGSVPESALRKAAQTAGNITFEDVRKKHAYTLIRDRFALRAKREGLEKLSPEIVERITGLFPRALADAAAENTYSLLNSGSLLTATADLVGLGGKAHEDLDKIFSPKSQAYVTFPSSLRGLTPVQRLGFAIHHGLTPLLYGRDANRLQFEQTVLSHASLATFYETDISPRITGLLEGEHGSTPMSLMELSTDIAVFDKLLKDGTAHPPPQGNERITLAGLRDATIVVGGKALYLHEKNYDWAQSYATPDFADWLTQKVVSCYPPHQQEQAHAYINDAITAGAIELIGDNPGEFRLVFSHAFYDEHVTEIDRAAVANAMGIDRILYGSDLTSAVRYRLGNSRESLQISRAQTPDIVTFGDDDLTEAEEALKLEAIGFENLPPLQKILAATFGVDYDFGKITDREWEKIGNNLLNAYSSYLERPNHQHEVQDEHTRAQVALAWTHARGGDIYAQARLFSLTGEDLEEYISGGMQLILEQFPHISHAQLKDTIQLLNKVARTKATHEAPVAPDKHSATINVAAPVITQTAQREPKPETPPVKTTAKKSAGSSVAPAPMAEAVTEEKIEEEPTVLNEGSVVIVSRENTEIGYTESLIQRYFNKAGRYPLLTPADEVELAKTIEAGVFASDKLAQGQVAPHDIADYQQLVWAGAAAKEKFINSNLRWVIKIAQKFAPIYSPSFLDYVQEGNLGLIRAVEKFDYTKGYKFSTYAKAWIEQSMKLSANKHDKQIYLPHEQAEKVRYYTAYTQKFFTDNSRRPTDEEVMQKFSWDKSTLEEVAHNAELNRIPSLSYTYKHRDEDGGEFGDFIEDTTAQQPEDIVLREDTNNSLHEIGGILQKTLLAERGKDIALTFALQHGFKIHPWVAGQNYIERHGIQDQCAYTPLQIADLLNISVSTVWNRLNSAKKLLNQTGVYESFRNKIQTTD